MAARIAALVGGAACLALVACCALLVIDHRLGGGVDLLAKVPQDVGQKSELAMVLKRQLNEQVKNQEKHLFDATLKREGIADALKNEGFQVPVSLKKAALEPSMAHVRKVQKRLRAVADSRSQSQHSKSDLPADVKLAQAILHHGSSASAAKSLSNAASVVAPNSKLVLSTVIEARSSRAGKKQAKVDEYLKHNVMEADAITELARKRKASLPSKMDQNMNIELATASEMMGNSLTPDAHAASDDGSVAEANGGRVISPDEHSIEMALKQKLNAVVAHREHKMFIRSMSNTISNIQTGQSAASKHFAASTQHSRRAQPRRTMSRIQIEHALKDKLDDITQSLEQKDLYKTELRSAPLPARRGFRASPSPSVVPPLSQSTFGGLNIKRSTEQSLEQELRSQLNSNVHNQEQTIFRSEAKHLLD